MALALAIGAGALSGLSLGTLGGGGSVLAVAAFTGFQALPALL